MFPYKKDVKTYARKRNTNPPIVHTEYPSLGGERIEYKVRVIQYNHPMIGTSEPMLDIRQFLTNHKNPDGTVYTGFGPSGVSLTLSDIHMLEEHLESIKDTITKVKV